MKPRHAVALAFWLILVPPIKGGQIDSSASLIGWSAYKQLFVSEANCETVRREFVNLASSPDPQKTVQHRVQDRLKSLPPASQADFAKVFAAEQQAICVSSEDPRFKPN